MVRSRRMRVVRERRIEIQVAYIPALRKISVGMRYPNDKLPERCGSLEESEENRLASKGDRTILEPQESTYMVGCGRDRCGHLGGRSAQGIYKGGDQARGCPASNSSSSA